uniref:Reticulon-like protein n=1 Tax=Rhizophora mucronata TaxID=61149 RepID=A0A2P2KXT0_RHIMU
MCSVRVFCHGKGMLFLGCLFFLAGQCNICLLVNSNFLFHQYVFF